MDSTASTQMTAWRRLFNHLIALLSALAAIAALVSILASTTMRAAIKSHSNWVYAGLVIAALIAFLAVDYAVSQNRKYRTLKVSISTASDHDKRLLQIILSQLPVDGKIMIWLRYNFFVKRMPAKLVDAIRDINEQLRLRPVGFDSPQVNDAYMKLLTAIETFDTTVAYFAIYEERNHGVDRESLQVPLDMKEGKGGPERYYDALNKIQEAASNFVGAYDNFLQTCQQNGLEIYDPKSPD